MAALLCVFSFLLKHVTLFTDADHRGNARPLEYSILPEKKSCQEKNVILGNLYL